MIFARRQVRVTEFHIKVEGDRIADEARATGTYTPVSEPKPASKANVRTTEPYDSLTHFCYRRAVSST